MNFLLLDARGFLAALLLAVGLLYFGGVNALLLILVFFVLGNIVTRIGQKTKKKLKIVEYSRSLKNVVSNGLVPLIFCAMGYEKAFIYSVAAVSADKFASELGVLFEVPVSLATWKKVVEGTSGAVSKVGTLFSAVGAFLIAVAAISLGYKMDVTMVTIVGVIGCFADSIVGILEEKGIGTKETSNLICAAVGGLFGLI